jgi:hypothetical protein
MDFASTRWVGLSPTEKPPGDLVWSPSCDFWHLGAENLGRRDWGAGIPHGGIAAEFNDWPGAGKNQRDYAVAASMLASGIAWFVRILFLECVARQV